MIHARLNHLRRTLLDPHISPRRSLNNILDAREIPHGDFKFSEHGRLRRVLVEDVRATEGEVVALNNACILLRAAVGHADANHRSMHGLGHLRAQMEVLSAFYVAIDLAAQIDEHRIISKLLLLLSYYVSSHMLHVEAREISFRMMNYGLAQIWCNLPSARRTPESNRRLKENLAKATLAANYQSDPGLAKDYPDLVLSGLKGAHFQKVAASVNLVTRRDEFDVILGQRDDCSKRVADAYPDVGEGSLFLGDHVDGCEDPYVLQILAYRALMPPGTFPANRLFAAPGYAIRVAVELVRAALSSPFFQNNYYESLRLDLKRMETRLLLS